MPACGADFSGSIPDIHLIYNFYFYIFIFLDSVIRFIYNKIKKWHFPPPGPPPAPSVLLDDMIL